MSQKLKNLNDLFEHELQDLYSAETQIIEALPKMAKEANEPKLKAAFEHHLKETQTQKKRLEQVFELLKIESKEKVCKAMEGLIAEGKNLIHEDATQETKDAALISAAQKIEHYEISAYGTVVYFSKLLGYENLQKILSETLAEEKAADKKLNELALETINDKAL